MPEDTILIKGGTVVSPADKINRKQDLLIAGGRIAKAGRGAGADRVINAAGCFVVPGLVDMHVHLREPGLEEKETIETGTNAAAAGGFTAVAAMPNTRPPVDNEAVVKFMLEVSRGARAAVFPVGAITQHMEGKALAEVGLMRKAGIVAISEDGKTVMDSSIMKNAMRYCLMDDTVIICHCEDMNLAAGGAMHEGRVSSRLGMRGIPRTAEEIIVAREIMLARETGARIHIAHVSTAGSVELVRRAKREKVRVTAETAPHYFTLTDDLIETFNPNLKVNPPLREKSDAAAVVKGLQDGTLDAIATDHAPHTVDEKDAEFDQTPNGLIGLETSVGVVLTELVHKKKISLSRMVELMSVNPAGILKVPGGTLAPGAPADVTVINPRKAWRVDPEKFFSKARNTPFAGRSLKGRAVVTITGGRVVYEDGELR